jgi:hypothetical protein
MILLNLSIVMAACFISSKGFLIATPPSDINPADPLPQRQNLVKVTTNTIPQAPLPERPPTLNLAKIQKCSKSKSCPKNQTCKSNKYCGNLVGKGDQCGVGGLNSNICKAGLVCNQKNYCGELVGKGGACGIGAAVNNVCKDGLVCLKVLNICGLSTTNKYLKGCPNGMVLNQVDVCVKVVGFG